MERSAYLRQTATDWLHYHPCPGTQDNIHRAFVAGGEWADAHPQNHWISVADRLPEKLNKFFSDFVLVMYTRGGKPYPFITRYDYECGMWEIENVTHWMPIPELPKEGEV